MKTLAAFAALLFAASQLSAQDQPAAKPAPAVPVAPVPAKKDPKAKPEPVYIIPGVTIARPNGTFLGLEVVEGNFKLSFYDKKKKPMAPDVIRASARWPNPRSVVGPNRTVLNVSGLALVGQKPVIPPLNFNVFITLLEGEDEDAKAVETYNVAFHG